MISKINRLQALCDLVPDNSNVADIGADHGTLELLLVAQKSNINILAIENKKGPFNNLSFNVKHLSNVRLSLSDGIKEVDGSIDTLVLAGMGGMNIINILKEYPDKISHIKTIICDAHKDAPEVRKYIVSLGFKISNESIVKDSGKFYVLSKFEKTKTKCIYSDSTYEFGLNLYKDELWNEYKEFLMHECNKIIDELKKSSCDAKNIEIISNRKERMLNYGKN